MLVQKLMLQRSKVSLLGFSLMEDKKPNVNK